MTVCQVAELVSIHSANEGVRRDRERETKKKKCKHYVYLRWLLLTLAVDGETEKSEMRSSV